MINKIQALLCFVLLIVIVGIVVLTLDVSSSQVTEAGESVGGYFCGQWVEAGHPAPADCPVADELTANTVPSPPRR